MARTMRHEAPSTVRLGAVVVLSAVGSLLWFLSRRRKPTAVNWYDTLPSYSMRNARGMEVHISSIGAAITKLLVPDKRGNVADVVLGWDKTSQYAENKGGTYFGAIVGRVANRIANASFQLNGQIYKLHANNGPNSLHGGVLGLHKRRWEGRQYRTDTFHAIELKYDSPEGEEGFPGHVHFTVTYKLALNANELTCFITASTDAATPINVAQHSYFNLAGHSSGSILQHTLHIPGGDHITAVSPTLIPTGELTPVAGTPFDFLKPHAVGERLAQVNGGYDHNYVLHNMAGQARFITKKGMASDRPKLAATIKDPKSGRAMDVLTTAPGMQFYSGNFLDGSIGKGGVHYVKYAGMALETQGFPDAINQPNFPSVVVEAADYYKHEIVYRFYNE